MKKFLSLVLILALVLGLGLVFTGCGDSEPYSKYDLNDYIELPDYNKFKTTVPDVQITDADIAAQIEKNLEAAAKTEKVTEGKVEKGDAVTIKFDGMLEDGTKVDGMSSESSELTLGSGSMIDGFEEGLYGATIGKEVEVKVTFPDPYTNNESLSGKPAVFKITVLSKNVKVKAELNDDFVKETSEYKTVAEYKASVAKYLEQQEYDEQLYDIKEKIYTEIVEKTEVKKYPEKEVEKEIKALAESYEQLAKNKDMTWEKYLSDELKMTQKEFDEQSKLYAQQVVKQEMIIYLIAEKEDIVITVEEYDEQLDAMLASTGFQDEDAFKQYTGMTLEEYAERYNLDRDLLLTKELDAIYERLTAK